jgi:hypothetical protein
VINPAVATVSLRARLQMSHQMPTPKPLLKRPAAADQRAMTLGQGYSAEFDGLYLQVETMQEGLQYRITKIGGGGGEVLPWTNGPAPGSEQYHEPPEGTKFEALTMAMGILKRSDDPHKVFEMLEWRPYGPGH